MTTKETTRVAGRREHAGLNKLNGDEPRRDYENKKIEQCSRIVENTEGNLKNRKKSLCGNTGQW